MLLYAFYSLHQSKLFHVSVIFKCPCAPVKELKCKKLSLTFEKKSLKMYKEPNGDLETFSGYMKMSSTTLTFR